MNVLVWLKRDLRVADHPALALAAGLGPVLPLYIAEPDYWALPDTSARQWAFTAETLTGLQGDLAACGAPLVVRVGCAVDVLARICRQNAITKIISHEEIGNAWTFERDRRVAAWARDAGIDWVELPQCGVSRGGKGRAGWATKRAVFANDTLLDAPALRAVPGVEPGTIPPARALRLAPDPCPHRQPGGRAQAEALMTSFLDQRGVAYRRSMSSPLLAERACSRLSPYLAAGVVSGRCVEQATRAQIEARPGPGWAPNLRSFESRLVWRDHFTQKLEDAPDMESRALHRAAGALPGRVTGGAAMEAWAAGETGFPYLDACMRYVTASGWLNFRARAMLVSFASYHLWLDWRSIGHVLARRFTDYDPGIHWPQVQMQSGMSGINRLRVYNPVKQGLEQDPTGAFTRRWVPELAGVPDGFLQIPWKWPGNGAVSARRYPEPVVDLATAAREAKATMAALRQRPEYRAEAEAIVIEHASPIGDRRFVNDRNPRPVGKRTRAATAPPGQMVMEF
jgi:deoxyribodipyrimidine photo-lyase